MITADIVERSSNLTDDYTERLDAFVNGLVPAMLSDAEYAARTSAVMIALNRQLARCAIAFGDVHGVTPEAMTTLVHGQFARNLKTCLAAVQGQGTTIN